MHHNDALNTIKYNAMQCSIWMVNLYSADVQNASNVLSHLEQQEANRIYLTSI